MLFHTANVSTTASFLDFASECRRERATRNFYDMIAGTSGDAPRLALSRHRQHQSLHRLYPKHDTGA